MNTIAYKFTKNNKLPELLRFFPTDNFVEAGKCSLIIDSDCKCTLFLGNMKLTLQSGRSIIDAKPLPDGEYEPRMLCGTTVYLGQKFKKEGSILKLIDDNERTLGSFVMLSELYERIATAEEAYTKILEKIGNAYTLKIT